MYHVIHSMDEIIINILRIIKFNRSHHFGMNVSTCGMSFVISFTFGLITPTIVVVSVSLKTWTDYETQWVSSVQETWGPKHPFRWICSLVPSLKTNLSNRLRRLITMASITLRESPPPSCKISIEN